MFSISPINFTSIQPMRKSMSNKVSIPQLKQDTFEKSISFKGNDKSSFDIWMDENGYTLADIQSFLDDENLIGQGNSNSAFAIPNCDDYCLRVLSSELDFIRNADFSTARIENKEDKNLNINIGQEVAKIYVKDIMPFPLEIQILRKQEGESIGVQPPETLVTGEYNSTTKEGVLPYEDNSRKEKYARTIHKVAQLPIEAYEKLLEELNQANEAGYHFDFLNSNNLLVNDKKEKVNFIDMSKSTGSNNPAALLYALTNSQYYKTYTSLGYLPLSEDEKAQKQQDIQQVLGDNITIIQKFLQAMKNKGIKFDKSTAPFEASLDLFSNIPFLIALRATSEYEVWDKLEKMGLANL